MAVNYQFSQLPLGEILIASDGAGICYLGFTDNDRESMLVDMKRYVCMKENDCIEQEDIHIRKALAGLANKSSLENYALSLYGTEFQREVWLFLQQCPFGSTMTYKEVATALGKPKAVRAVASAIGKNRIAILIPCHRIVRTTGQLAGYRWGLERKKALLEEETIRLKSNK